MEASDASISRSALCGKIERDRPRSLFTHEASSCLYIAFVGRFWDHSILGVWFLYLVFFSACFLWAVLQSLIWSSAILTPVDTLLGVMNGPSHTYGMIFSRQLTSIPA